ncbi:MAG: ATP-dependent DNA ligase [Candidatus Eremiobacteraeota bacterium]|nr:ATP-dependent DNA ligase [Candidatus Eremiobacteraeota bacterium]
MKRFAAICESVAATPAKNEKIALLAEYLRELDDRDLEAAARFFTGTPFAARDERTLSLGGQTLVAAARAVWEFNDAQLGAAYREHGDLGAALGELVRPPARLALFDDALQPHVLKKRFDEIAAARGKNSARKRQAICERIFAACGDSLEATYVTKIMTGDLRIGLREGLILEAIAAAFEAPAADVRRSAMAAGDVGAVAVAARHGTLADIAVRYGAPIAFMLASPVQYGSGYRELQAGSWSIEDKLDGIRAQLHKEGDAVRIFSRTLNDVARSYPEVVDAAQRISGSFVIDGEIVAMRGDGVLPFRFLQARLQRKTVDATLMEEVPVALWCFDLLARNEEFLLEEPLAERRAQLAALVGADGAVRLTPWSELESGGDAETLHAAFEASRARGNEGLMLKRNDAPYFPGKRGKWWLKLKRELSTLDVVVVAVEWGHGKRAKVLSDYTFAVRGPNDALLTIGKAYSGLTDAEIATLTEWFLAHRLPVDRQRPRARSHEIPVEPEIVLEVAFDVIQKSDLHESGFALRFPRIVRIRDDKLPQDIDALGRVEELYREMLAREGLR